MKLNNTNIDLDNKNNKYIDYRSSFIPTTEQEFVALEIAQKLNDLDAIKFHVATVKEIGVTKARELCALTLEDASIARATGKTPIRKLGALYNWKVNRVRGRENA